MDKDYSYSRFTGRNGNFYAILDFELWIAEHDHEDQDEHVVTQCPHCLIAYQNDISYHGRPYLKHKLYIKNDLSKGYCHRCNTAFFNKSIDNEELTKEQLLEITDLASNYESTDLDFDMKDSKWQLSNYLESKELKYLEIINLYERNPYILDTYEKLGIKSFSHFRDGIIIPFYFKGELIYYQIWCKGHTPKYFNPPIMTKPLYFCGEVKNKAILVEGVFDAIACLTLFPDYTPIAVLGSTITKAQTLMLREYLWDEILVYMDKSSLSYAVCNKLRRIMDNTDFNVHESDGQDPEEYLRSIINKQFNK